MGLGVADLKRKVCASLVAVVCYFGIARLFGRQSLHFLWPQEEAMPIHIVKLGDSMSSIADQYGFFWQTLWTHEKNAALAALRGNPNILLPKDRVFIPDKRRREESGMTAKIHTFQLKGVPARLNFRLRDVWGQPRSGVRYTLTVDGNAVSATTGPDGLISQVIPPRAQQATLNLPAGEQYQFNLGFLNPFDSPSGIQGRLKNLGYYQQEPSGKLDDVTQQALRRFQADANLPVTGEADQATQNALVALHGC
jgi:hypothetical protein